MFNERGSVFKERCGGAVWKGSLAVFSSQSKAGRCGACHTFDRSRLAQFSCTLEAGRGGRDMEGSLVLRSWDGFFWRWVIE